MISSRVFDADALLLLILHCYLATATTLSTVNFAWHMDESLGIRKPTS